MINAISTDSFKVTLKSFGLASFSTKQFIDAYKDQYPAEWQEIETKYGVGGKGVGRYYSSFSRVAHSLNALARLGELKKLNYRPAPPGWGNAIIRFWTLDREAKGGRLYPDEVGDDFEEGEKTQVVVNKYERDKSARLRCIEHHGLACAVCDFDFEDRYGAYGAGFIHVHHLEKISSKNGPYKINAKTDLVPICPNCHAMIHYRNPMLSIQELREILAEKGSPAGH